MDEYIVSIISGVLVGSITAWITVRLSLRKFFSERWWERKAESYTEIVEALYNIQNNLKEISIALSGISQQYDDSEYDRLAKLSSQGYDQLHRVSAIGAFTISEDAVSTLHSLMTKSGELDREEIRPKEWIEGLPRWKINRRLELVSHALVEIIRIAKRDLKVE